MAVAAPLPDLEPVFDRRRAVAMLDPLRLRILEQARAPVSATEMGVRLKVPRQKVNYHMRELASARLLRRAGQRRKRNMIERLWVATARAYVLDPALLGEVAADETSVADVASAAFQMALTSRLQADVGRAAREAKAAGKRLATLTLHSEIRFESADQQRGFYEALQSAFVTIVARHTSPARLADGSAAAGRPYRLIAACCPIPGESSTGETLEISK